MVNAAAKRHRICTDDIAALPEDVLLEVFSRVGSVGDLFRFAVTCRQWLRRFTDPVFLVRLCPAHSEGHRAHLLGFFFQQTSFVLPRRWAMRALAMETRMAQRASVSAPSFLPAPGSPLGPGSQALTSFVAADDGTFNYAEPLAARRGIVLMLLVPCTFDLKRVRATGHLLGLCNPITGERHVLPPLDPGHWYTDVDSYAIITETDSDLDATRAPLSSSSGRFKFSQLLVTTTRINRNYVHLHSYSTTTRGWSTPTVCLDGSRFSMIGGRSAVIHQGAAHWLCVDHKPCPPRDDYLLYKLSAEVGTATPCVSLTKIPIRGGGSPYLCISRDDKLSVACVYRLHVTVWTQQSREEDGDAMWLNTAVITLPKAEPNLNSPPLCQTRGECTWLDFSKGSMLAFPRSGGVFVLDLEKKKMEKVMDCVLPLFSNERDSGARDGTCVSYEIDLVEFFMLQLGGVCKRL